MKYYLSLAFLFFVMNLWAVKPTTNPEDILQKFDESSIIIDQELEALQQINQKVLEENLDYTSLQASDAALVNDLNLSSSVDIGILKGDSDKPLGIPGFVWGFCLGLIGILIIYLAMDEGPERKKQVRNGVYGCLVGVLLSVLLQVVILSAQ